MRDKKKNEAAEAIDVREAVNAVIGREQVIAAEQTRIEYKKGKEKQDNRVIACHRWYKSYTEDIFQKKDSEPNPKSAWLFNSIASKHADIMDNIPSANVLPREEADKSEAQKLSSIIPVIMDQNRFKKVYSESGDDKLIDGTGIVSVLWDQSKLNGLGDISIKCVSGLNVFIEPGVKDIQDSRNLFFTQLVDNDILEQQYPQTRGMLKGGADEQAHYEYDDSVSTDKKSIVVDWYYKKQVNGKTILHYCKYVNDIVLYATENDTQRPTRQAVDEKGVPVFEPITLKPIMVEDGESKAERGWYDHGKYPFVFDPLYKIKGTPWGYGFVNVGCSPQENIDRMDKLFLENMEVNSKPRWFIKTDGSVKEEEYANTNNTFIHVDGNLGQDSIIAARGTPLNGIYVSMLNNKIEELKETTGNRDVSNGGTSGATAASAIAAMQEAGSKLSRDSNTQTYEAYNEIVLLVIELIRQYYDTERSFRITGEDGSETFIKYSNAGIVPQPQGANGTTEEFGVDVGYRVPLFDLEVVAQRQSPYTKLAQNELALQLYSAGFFNADNADAALACLDMMDFDRKSFVMNRIKQNGTMLDMLNQMQKQMAMLQAQLDAVTGLPPTVQAQEAPPTVQAETAPERSGDVSLPVDARESSVTKKARIQSAERSAPR